MNNEENKEKSPEEIKAENKNMIRSCIIGAVVIVLFIGIYFAFGGRGDNAEKTAQKTEQTAKPEATADSGSKEEKAEKSEESGKAESPAPKSGEKAEKSEDIYKKYDIKYTRDQALEEAKKAAAKQFGADAFVIPASDETPSEVEIDGKMRACYMFGADSLANMSGENASMRGLYHFDAVTGEIFDNADGKMVKIN